MSYAISKRFSIIKDLFNLDSSFDYGDVNAFKKHFNDRHTFNGTVVDRGVQEISEAKGGGGGDRCPFLNERGRTKISLFSV